MRFRERVSPAGAQARRATPGGWGSPAALLRTARKDRVEDADQSGGGEARPGSPAPLCVAAAGRGRAAGHLGARRLERRLHGPRDLRRRRQHHPRRERQDRRREGRDGRVGHAHAAAEGRGRAEHRKPRLPGLPRRRQLHDPPAGADRREVRRLPADPAARRRHAAAAAAEEDPQRPGRRGRVPAAGAEHTRARSTSTCSATSTACPSASASRSSSTNSAPAWPGAAAT